MSKQAIRGTRQITWTDKAIKALKPEEKKYEARDKGGTGRAILVRPTGKKVYLLSYRFGGKARSATIGRYPDTSLASANKVYADMEAQLENGIDPGAKALQVKEELAAADTFAELAIRFLEFKRSKPGAVERTWKEAERIFKRDVNPAIGNTKAQSVTRAQIGKIVAALEARGKATQARRTLGWIRSVLRYGLSRGMLEADPSAGLSVDPKSARDRVLSGDEIRAAWGAGEMEERTRLALRWLLVLGQRVEQSLAVRWDEIEGAWWTVPREKFKGKKEFRVPLNDRAKEIMERLEELDKDLPVKPEYLFHDGGGTKLLRDTSRAVTNNASTLQKGATPWWPRDIRRTVATGLGDLDERDDDIRHLVLGHARPTLSKTYIRDAKYDAPKRAMFLRWEQDLNRILRGEPRPDPDEKPLAPVIPISA